jgi:hypothetical protein
VLLLATTSKDSFFEHQEDPANNIHGSSSICFSEILTTLSVMRMWEVMI